MSHLLGTFVPLKVKIVNHRKFLGICPDILHQKVQGLNMPRTRQGEPPLAQPASEKFNLIELIPIFVLARDPNTLEESINAALIEEQNLKLPTESQSFQHKLQELNLRVERLQEASTVIARETSKGEFHRKGNVFKCFSCGLEGHQQAECRKRIADQRPWNLPPFRRSVRGEILVSRSSRIQSVNQRRVRFHDSALLDDYATPRSIQGRFPPVSQRNFREIGNAGGFRQNRGNENLNFRGQY
ncbi:hypothetical protein TNCV_4772851 [Trichonephila clavipes]|nr:hypothetical protein TNCV_4772851 [Trichonephila clavipes]